MEACLDQRYASRRVTRSLYTSLTIPLTTSQFIGIHSLKFFYFIFDKIIGIHLINRYYINFVLYQLLLKLCVISYWFSDFTRRQPSYFLNQLFPFFPYNTLYIIYCLCRYRKYRDLGRRHLILLVFLMDFKVMKSQLTN